MERVIDIIRVDDYCPSCKSKFSIELYDVYGNALGLTRMLNRNILRQSINEKRLSHMECKKCGKKFKILYHDNRLIPLDESINIEYNDFNKHLKDNIGILYGGRK